jgi:hypothetical protein
MSSEPATPLVATAAMAAPWWLPALKQASVYAGDWLPILGAVWLVVQIVTRIVEAIRRR